MRVSLPCLVLGAALALSGAQAAPSVYVAYPPDGHRVPFDHVLLEGSVAPGAALTVGGVAVPTGPDGLFITWWPLKPGANALRLVARQGGQSAARVLTVIRTVPTRLPATPTAIARASVQPAQPLEFWDPAGDTAAERRVPVRFEGSPGGQASVRVAGGPAQPLTEGPAGVYSGAYTLPPGAVLNTAPLVVSLRGRDGRTVSATAPGRLSSAPGTARTVLQPPGSVPGLGVNAAGTRLTTLSGQPLLYPREAMTFRAVGRVGPDLRVRLAPGVGALVTAAQVAPLGFAAPPTPAGGAITVDAVPGPLAPDTPVPVAPAPLPKVAGPAQPGPVARPAPELHLRLPLGAARPPFTLEQPSARRVTLTLYGPPLAPFTPPAGPLPWPLERLEVQPLAGGITQISAVLAAPLWGFTANPDGDELRLTLRLPPTLDPARPLAGRVITLDPGHGGSQNGGAGSLRVPEKDLVLPIALRAAELLRAQGASVNLTRSGDVTLGLVERGLLAEAAGSDLLISIHANALPDGRDPRGIRGPEVYFTHPQAQPLAAALLSALRERLPDLGPGTGLKPGADLALTRPTTQPSVLVELGYLTDPGNLRLLHSPGGQERMAQAIAQGVADLFQAEAAR
ncbi:N-acetylmuramoyl-L-alanine amidase family protein [Deinococcus arcticus]|uniref:N-acetylmuramoyl-L-alanine amidase n=1 Tax=Deinococcus arcticus TaxID=2136176 RepID=A0A2T3WBD2_9DEIO|nr:N-acetylmuramoyl-L-alanine amidase [Deinococcus arcticus]PTA69114.1 N-acetylmuramoyl-L-alanine amidase [Deinococcus arcticus]